MAPAPARGGPPPAGPLRRLADWWGPSPVAQAAVILVLAVLAHALAANVVATMARIGISPGFGFLWRSANFEIGESPIAFRAGDAYARALLVGLLNTLKVAALGCLLATVLGALVGVAGMSSNPLLAALVRWYVEIVRNTPLLLQLFFWIALAQALPPPRQAISAFDAAFLSNRGVFVPGLVLEGATAWTWAAVAAVALLAALALRAGRRRGALTPARGGAVALAALALAGLAAGLTGAGARLDVPALAGFNIRGGWSLTPEFAALLTGLTVKFSAAIAEIVRAGVQSVKAGQWEAARALGLGDGRILRLVVLPQALRVITPLTTSSYLDLTKDSSLAVAIGYPDLVSIVNTTANTTGQAFEALLILVAVYVTINLAVAWAMNRYNARVALRGGRPA